MRIISKFKDYYDGVLKTQVSDPSYALVRKTREQPIAKRVTHTYRHGRYPVHYLFHCNVIGFCGKLFPFVEVVECSDDKPSERYLCYSMDEMAKEYPGLVAMPRVGRYGGLTIHGEVAFWIEKGERQRWWRGVEYDIFADPEIRDVFQKERVAYFLIESPGLYPSLTKPQTIIFYPRLLDYQFFKVKDPFTAFQEIEMFMGNELAPPDMIEAPVSDKLKAETHGFDKWSFRKEPQDGNTK